MRISGGTLKGRTFYPPADHWPTRPTTDFSRTALFNILNNRLDFEEVRFLDLFGGTGAHSYEIISRGCQQVVYVDKFKPAVQFVTEKARLWGIESKIRIVHSDYLLYVRSSRDQFDYIFAGPPYDLPKLDEIPDLVMHSHLLEESGLFVLEHNPRHDFCAHEHFYETRNYGQTIFTFFRHTFEKGAQ
ncbi:MAG: RsmD family RNA methyltransferase [Saprospiraceae bacterium]|nr:RsmD family RNA methyltransferase [Saprospiraceae bacterium]HMW39939.1 RsmD family RNA methyltransferase [Saprospiraceae bacterium]HMX86882.1 RsmD family RNA methyltransferase [Saprospiraceae bacterium]HMZ39010.1 RsmD family RNA methyltransferase [Saprospiraceae bacterium]HNA64824.1 RsmD family RNA methyltransferase [Saprospiraceae bacterium]